MGFRTWNTMPIGTDTPGAMVERLAALVLCLLLVVVARLAVDKTAGLAGESSRCSYEEARPLLFEYSRR
jgi:hypothetical protein